MGLLYGFPNLKQTLITKCLFESNWSLDQTTVHDFINMTK